MTQKIHKIPIEKLIAHPNNPNRMSSVTFAKLVQNIERTGRYEPIVVRAYTTTNCHSPQDTIQCREGGNTDTNVNAKCSCFQIINGHHRVKALKKLRFETADCLIWDVDDHEADILLATLNRLAGTDELDKKLSLLRRLSEKTKAVELAKLLPQTARQIERLNNLKLPKAPANIKHANFLIPLTFFVNNNQHEIIRRAMSLATDSRNKCKKAKRNATALTRIAEFFIKTNCLPENNSSFHPEQSEVSSQLKRTNKRDINTSGNPDSSVAPQNDINKSK